MSRFSITTLIVIIFSFLILNCNTVHAGGFVTGDFFNAYVWALEAGFVIGIFGAVFSFIAGIVGGLTGKFTVKLYVPFIFLLVSMVSFILMVRSY